MDEFIRVRFKRNGQRWRVWRHLTGGIEFEEPDPIERTVGLTFDARSDATRERMNSIRRLHGWAPGQYLLKMSVEDGALVLRGFNAHALPEGLYKLRFQIEEMKTLGGAAIADIDHDRSADVDVEVQTDDRTIEVDLAGADATIAEVIGRSAIDGLAASTWVTAQQRRATRRACLLNLLASIRTRPSVGAPLADLVHDIFFVSNDRMYAKVDRALLQVLRRLAEDPKKPFFEEGTPHAGIHGRLLEALPEPPDVKVRFRTLCSFRGEGGPSLQVVVAVSPPDLAHTYAEFDLDLGNPLQDIAGFFVHMGELLDGKPTNHLDLHKRLNKTRAKHFLYYKVQTA